MSNFLFTLLFSFFLIMSACSEKTSCENLPQSFTSYTEAKKQIKSAKFKIKEEAITERSSWIRGATYFSCDGETGCFLFKTDSKEYIYKGVPYTIWNGFKKAESLGRYYNNYIKDKYKLTLN